MTKPEQIAASVRQRLKNLTGTADFQTTLVLYALERLLYRLSRSTYQQQFILKGALLFNIWSERFHRATRDADLLGFGDSTPEFEPLLDENEEKAARSCNLDQIPAEFNKLLQKAVGFLRRKKYYLTIEFFLPSSLMCIEIDRWKIKINNNWAIACPKHSITSIRRRGYHISGTHHQINV